MKNKTKLVEHKHKNHESGQRVEERESYGWNEIIAEREFTKVQNWRRRERVSLSR